MQKHLTFVAVSLFGTAAASMATMPTPGYSMSLQQQLSLFSTSNTQETSTKDVVSPKPKEKRLICQGCNENENKVLSVLQDRGIKDRAAIATVMGNIKQESQFIPNICEGTGIVPYHHCRRGGFGLIQFTSSDRYYGLGSFAKSTGGDPSTLDTQIEYMFTEPQWKRIQDGLMTPGKPINHYMNLAYSWIGWGIHGARTHYAHDYLRRLVEVDA